MSYSENNIYAKKLWLAIEISQLLSNHGCTYCETEEILSMLLAEYDQQRIDIEFNTVSDFMNDNKNRNCGHDFIRPLNHVDGYC